MLAAAVLGAGGAVVTPLFASNPASSTLSVPSSAGQTAEVSWAGTIGPGQSGDPVDGGVCPATGGTDEHALTISVPAGFYDTKAAVYTFSITWDPANPTGDATLNDEVITVRNEAGNVVGKKDGSETTEVVTLSNLPGGKYTVQACGFVNTTDQPYTAKASVKTAPGSFNPNTQNDGLLSFTDATVVDPILFGGEPGINFDNTRGDAGEHSYVDWPVSSRVNIGVLFRSDDGGLSYRKRYADPTDVNNSGGPCLGRQVPTCTGGGGGDTDVNINPTNGNLYFSSQESLAAQLVGASFDHGDTFPTANTNPAVSAPCTGVDRQWLASLGGTDTVFLAYHIPIAGECFSKSTDAGQTWSIQPLGVTNVTQSGALVADNTGKATNHYLYMVYNTSLLAGTSGSGQYGIAVSKDEGSTWTTHVIPGTKSLRNFNKLQIDSDGNLYATWVQSDTNHTYLSTSKADAANPAAAWSTPVIVDGGPVIITIFPDIAAGSPGRVAVAYYGTTASAESPDDVQPGTGGWSPYVAYTDNALCQWDASPCKSPTFHQGPISHTINHDDNICTSGTTCIVLPSPSHPGNRNLLDYFDITLDKAGHLGFVWGDTRNQTGLPFVKVARQSTGPSLYAGQPDASLPKRANGQGDATGDALWPIAGDQVKTASNLPGLDLTSTSVSLIGTSGSDLKLQFTIGLADASKLNAVPSLSPSDDTAVQQAKLVTRWDFKGHSYYAAANIAPGGQPSFFAGEVSTAESVSAPGSTATFGNSYKSLLSATGRVEGNKVIIEVPAASVGSPTLNDPVYSLASYSMLGPTDAITILNVLPVTVDATPTFDIALAGPAATVVREEREAAARAAAAAARGPLPATGESPVLPLAGTAAAVVAAAMFGLRRRSRRA